MDEKFRLVFRGEILDGQHRAVVKRRLAERLKLDEGQIEKLFTGKPVVVKRDADRETAARYQNAFRQAGGLLRIEAVGAAGSAARAAPGKPVRPAVATDPGLENARIRAIRPGANPDVVAPEFSVQGSYFPPPADPAAEIQAPAFVVAEVGTLLKEPGAEPAAPMVHTDFDLAEVGADLLPHRPVVEAVNLGPLDFELAEVGADLGPGPRGPTPAAPDVSHLALVEARRDPN